MNTDIEQLICKHLPTAHEIEVFRADTARLSYYDRMDRWGIEIYEPRHEDFIDDLIPLNLTGQEIEQAVFEFDAALSEIECLFFKTRKSNN